MMKLVLVAGVALTLTAPNLVQAAAATKAAPRMSNMQGMSHGGMTMADGTGIVRAVDPTAGTVTLEHAPIPALKWPAMVMKLKANPPTLLKGLRVGQSVKFQLMQMGENTEVTAIRSN